MTTLLSSALGSVPAPISTALEKEYVELESRFAQKDWGPAELNGGRFAEALLRYMEWKVSGSYTPIGRQLNRSKVIDKEVRNAGALPEGIRFHMAKCAELLMDVRNKRDVAHLGNVVDVSEMDAHLVLRLASWSLAELIRVESGLPAGEAQELIDRLSTRRVALVEEIDGRLVVVATNLTAINRALVALYHTFPRPLPLEDLRVAVKYSHRSRFRALLQKVDAEGLVHLTDGKCVLTRKGVVWVERNIDLRLQV